MARLTPIPASRTKEMIDNGELRPARISTLDLPDRTPGPSLSAEILRMRDEERF